MKSPSKQALGIFSFPKEKFVSTCFRAKRFKEILEDVKEKIYGDFQYEGKRYCAELHKFKKGFSILIIPESIKEKYYVFQAKYKPFYQKDHLLLHGIELEKMFIQAMQNKLPYGNSCGIKIFRNATKENKMQELQSTTLDINVKKKRKSEEKEFTLDESEILKFYLKVESNSPLIRSFVLVVEFRTILKIWKLIEQLPNDLYIQILQFLPVKDVVHRIRLINKKFNQLGDSEVMWKHRYQLFKPQKPKQYKKKSWRENFFLDFKWDKNLSIRETKIMMGNFHSQKEYNNDFQFFKGSDKKKIKVQGNIMECIYSKPYVSCADHCEWKIEIDHELEETDTLFVGLVPRKLEEFAKTMGRKNGYGCNIVNRCIYFQNQLQFCPCGSLNDCLCQEGWIDSKYYKPKDIITVSIQNYVMKVITNDYCMHCDIERNTQDVCLALTIRNSSIVTLHSFKKFEE